MTPPANVLILCYCATMPCLDVDNLRWFLESPGLLRATPSQPLVTDEFLRSLTLNSIDLSKLSRDLDGARQTRRLGRYVESLTAFMIEHVLRPQRLEIGVPIRSGKRTVGELDVLFSTETERDEHWELSVKFYICLRGGSSRQNEFMGTFVEDRLDRKLAHLFETQRPLVETSEAQTELSARGWMKPFTSRVLMKGLFFYPATSSAWFSSSTQLPAELSPSHERGWWTTSSELHFPRVSTGLYLRLDQLQWLSSVHREVRDDDLLSADDLRALCNSHFPAVLDGAWLRRKELTVAEVELVSPGVCRELARGHIVHAAWPELAAWAADQSLEQLEISQRGQAKRPRTP